MKAGYKRTIQDKKHVLVVLKITSRDKHGRPKQANILYDEDVEHIDGGEEFITAFIQEETVAKTRVN